jgi:hypothetical protein
MGSGSDVEAGIVVCGLDPVNLSRFEEQDLAGILYDKALGGWGCWPMILDPVLRPAESTLESGIVKWLQKVIEGPGFESPEGIVIVSSDKDYRRRHVSAKHFDHVEPVALGHLNIEEH